MDCSRASEATHGCVEVRAAWVITACHLKVQTESCPALQPCALTLKDVRANEAGTTALPHEMVMLPSSGCLAGAESLRKAPCIALNAMDRTCERASMWETLLCDFSRCWRPPRNRHVAVTNTRARTKLRLVMYRASCLASLSLLYCFPKVARGQACQVLSLHICDKVWLSDCFVSISATRGRLSQDVHIKLSLTIEWRCSSQNVRIAPAARCCSLRLHRPWPGR